VFSNKDLKKLLIPLIIEQVLGAFMGTADTMMVSAIGAASISGVSLVNTIDTLMVYLFSALATGGTIVCAQYLGARDRDGANNGARQVYLSTFALSMVIMILCLAFRLPMLRLLFGAVDADVMAAAQTYFLITALSYPFIALYNAGAALYRATGNSKLPMRVAFATNLLNVAGNAVLMFGLHMGVAGAAISTLASRMLGAVIILTMQQRPGQELTVGNYLKIRPDWAVIGLVLKIGIPTGLENSLFQVGKLAVQSTVSTLGTTAIAAQAMTIVLEAFTSQPSMAVGLALTTVAGQCIGAGRPDEARRYTKKLTIWSWCILVGISIVILAATKPITILGGMTAESAALCWQMMLVITFIKPLVWTQAFTVPNGMRAAGDVTFVMLVSVCSMWVFRVGVCVTLCRHFGFGPMGVCGCVFLYRFHSGKWVHAALIKGKS
jgi:putative MATE family efflux protein